MQIKFFWIEKIDTTFILSRLYDQPVLVMTQVSLPAYQSIDIQLIKVGVVTYTNIQKSACSEPLQIYLINIPITLLKCICLALKNDLPH
jgi:hypothetical protein